jgi:Xaa-Pro aminopeptidase
MSVTAASASDQAAPGRRARHERLVELMDRGALDAVVLRRHQNFAWYTGGGDSRVDHASPFGVADLVVTREAAVVVTTNIEAERMHSEQTPWAESLAYPWHTDARRALRAAAGGRRLGCDTALEDAVDVSGDVAQLRRVLDPDAIARLRAVGADAHAALTEVAATVAPGLTERELAADIAHACRRRGLHPSVLLAAADERIARWRHPLPHDAAVTRRAMLVVSAERGGLYANLTQLVELEAPSSELARRIAATGKILAGMRAATRPGRSLSALFAECRSLYAQAGYPDQWQFHHQGGSTGYASREVIATPDTHDVVKPGQAFAWNPSITGAKAEETFVLTPQGPEVVTTGAPKL